MDGSRGISLSYTYIYLDPRKPGQYFYEEFSFDYEPFYVGKGTGKRILAHLEYAKDTESVRSKHNISRIRKILEEGLEPVILKVLDNVSNEEALELEARLIKLIGRLDKGEGSLLNFTDGGGRSLGNNGLVDFHHKEETKQKISKTSKGHKKSEEFKKKIGELKKGNTNMLGKKHEPGRMEERSKRGILKTLRVMVNNGLDLTEENFDASRPCTKGSGSYPRFKTVFNYFASEELQQLISDIQQGK